MDLGYTENVKRLIMSVNDYIDKKKHRYVTPEHFLFCISCQEEFQTVLSVCNVKSGGLRLGLMEYLDNMETRSGHEPPVTSRQMKDVINLAADYAAHNKSNIVDVPHLVQAMYSLTDSWAHYVLDKFVRDQNILLTLLYASYGTSQAGEANATYSDGSYDNYDAGEGDFEEGDYDDGDMDAAGERDALARYARCLNDECDKHILVGREAEMERTIQVLCRKTKNNPLYIGEPGVGKTTLVMGLARMMVENNVPERLKDSRVYTLDLGALLAGTQYRGDFEKRLKMVMEEAAIEKNAIIYIDEIHNLVGAGQIGEGAMDASNIIMPYMDSGEVRFIGCTTYQDYNRYFSKNKGLVRRFQQIDVLEPTIEEAKQIVGGLLPEYEKYHRVHYADDVVSYAVEQSARLITNRFLPDKAIDLIDEAGAYREQHPLTTRTGNVKPRKQQVVDVQLINDVLAKVCKINAKALTEDANDDLATLEERIKSQIYGQDEAVRQVVESVQMAKAGLLADNKPMASLLFVGPTGVGKTEVCKVLAQELGIELVRFDMSEYAEKHTVAKLIGSPAGYVGYEDGGLLTDAIRKSPNCVLLLDEIEKAHSDIYNILLQVMDYAKLTDNKGQKADFKNVIVIMTSNAGAQYAGQASVGFGSTVTAGQAMLAQVKKTFKPEFLNRLSGTVVFRDMDLTMAGMILDKKLRQLSSKLTAKSVTLSLSESARAYLLKAGYTKQYGAREMDRVIQQKLNPLLMREILFGSLKKGGEALIEVMNGDTLTLKA